MIKAMIGFNKSILAMAIPWRIWMVLLVSVNLVLPLFFLGTLEAKVALVGMMASMSIMLILFAKLGFVRLLGLGHFPWLFTVPWLGSRWGQTVDSGPFYYWLLAIVAINGISLVIDAVDVVRYGMGDRQPTLATDA